MKTDSFVVKKAKGKNLVQHFSYKLKQELWDEYLWDYNLEHRVLAYIIPEYTSDTIYKISEWDDSFTGKHVIDTFHSYPLVYYDIQLVWFSEKGEVIRLDSFPIREDVVIKLKFAGSKLLIDAERSDNQPGFTPVFSHGYLDLKETSLTFQPILNPSELNTEYISSDLLSDIIYHNNKFYTLYPRYISDYYIAKYDLSNGFQLEQLYEIPKAISNIISFSCDGHDYISINGSKSFTVNDNWAVFYVNFSCFGQMLMFEDCFGNAHFLGIMDSKTMEVKYLLNNSFLDCPSHTSKPLGVINPNISQVHLEGNKLYLKIGLDSLLFVNLDDPKLQECFYNENDSITQIEKKAQIFNSCIKKLDLPFDPLIIYPISSTKAIITDYQKWLLLPSK